MGAAILGWGLTPLRRDIYIFSVAGAAIHVEETIATAHFLKQILNISGVFLGSESLETLLGSSGTVVAPLVPG